MAVPVITSIEQAHPGPVQHMLVPVVVAPYAEPCMMYQPMGDVWVSPYHYSQGWYDKSKGSRLPRKKHSKSSASGPRSGMGGMWHEQGRGSYGYQDYAKAHQDFARAHQDSPKAQRVHEQHNDETANVSVVLSGLPKMLCSEACLKAMFEQANIEDGVRSFTVKQNEEEKQGVAVVILKSKTSAEMMIKHFEGLRCGQNITARYMEVGEDMNDQSRNSGIEHEQQEEGNAATRLDEDSSPSGSDHTPSKRVSRSSVLSKSSLKQRWADMNDDSDSDSTNAGQLTSFSSDTIESSSNPDEN